MRFRRCLRWGVIAALLAVAGCGSGGDVDGDLTNDWGAMAPASGFVPVAETCHLSNFAAGGPTDAGLRARQVAEVLGQALGVAGLVPEAHFFSVGVSAVRVAGAAALVGRLLGGGSGRVVVGGRRPTAA